MNSLKSFISLTVLVQLSLALPTPDRNLTPRSCERCVEGLGEFQKHVTYKFTGTTLPEGLHASDAQLIHDQNNGAPYNHRFEASNVVVKDGFLQIKVPGGQTPATRPDSAIFAGEVFTSDSNILYGSIRTNAIMSTVPGTCQGAFFYKSDTQETDIEFLSDPASKANAGQGAGLHYTNQPTHGGDSTTAYGAAPSSIGSAVHEYRIDWTADYTAFYLDGVLQKKHTTNVPQQGGTWLWNNWANGDIQWSAGPPAKDSIMKIQSIEMYYNTTSGGA